MRAIRVENCIVNEQNISGKNSFMDTERMLCDHIYIFVYHYHHQ